MRSGAVKIADISTVEAAVTICSLILPCPAVPTV
jgi:hypothetical protein